MRSALPTVNADINALVRGMARTQAAADLRLFVMDSCPAGIAQPSVSATTG